MPLQLFSSPYVQTYKRTDRETASRTWRCIFLFPYWGETPAELRPLLGPLSLSQMVDESVQGICGVVNVRKPTVSTTNPKRTTPGLKQDLRGENIVTNCLSYNMVPWRSNRLIVQFLFRGELARNRTIIVLNSKWQKYIKNKILFLLNFWCYCVYFSNCITREFVYNSATAG